MQKKLAPTRLPGLLRGLEHHMILNHHHHHEA